jgi:predicted kinase
MEQKNNLVVIMLIGIPCAGKSTWVEENTNKLMDKYNCPLITVSRDLIRLEMSSNGKYNYDTVNEKEVTNRYYKQLSTALAMKSAVIILDNTHLRESHINSMLITLGAMIKAEKVQFYIKVFKTPFLKCWIRNFKRKIQTGKWIPLKVMKDFQRRFDTLLYQLETKYKKYYYD